MGLPDASGTSVGHWTSFQGGTPYYASGPGPGGHTDAPPPGYSPPPQQQYVTAAQIMPSDLQKARAEGRTFDVQHGNLTETRVYVGPQWQMKDTAGNVIATFSSQESAQNYIQLHQASEVLPPGPAASPPGATMLYVGVGPNGEAIQGYATGGVTTAQEVQRLLAQQQFEPQASQEFSKMGIFSRAIEAARTFAGPYGGQMVAGTIARNPGAVREAIVKNVARGDYLKSLDVQLTPEQLSKMSVADYTKLKAPAYREQQAQTFETFGSYPGQVVVAYYGAEAAAGILRPFFATQLGAAVARPLGFGLQAAAVGFEGVKFYNLAKQGTSKSMLIAEASKDILVLGAGYTGAERGAKEGLPLAYGNVKAVPKMQPPEGSGLTPEEYGELMGKQSIWRGIYLRDELQAAPLLGVTGNGKVVPGMPTSQQLGGAWVGEGFRPEFAGGIGRVMGVQALKGVYPEQEILIKGQKFELASGLYQGKSAFVAKEIDFTKAGLTTEEADVLKAFAAKHSDVVLMYGSSTEYSQLPAHLQSGFRVGDVDFRLEVGQGTGEKMVGELTGMFESKGIGVMTGGPDKPTQLWLSQAGTVNKLDIHTLGDTGLLSSSLSAGEIGEGFTTQAPIKIGGLKSQGLGEQLSARYVTTTSAGLKGFEPMADRAKDVPRFPVDVEAMLESREVSWQAAAPWYAAKTASLRAVQTAVFGGPPLSGEGNVLIAKVSGGPAVSFGSIGSTSAGINFAASSLSASASKGGLYSFSSSSPSRSSLSISVSPSRYVSPYGSSPPSSSYSSSPSRSLSSLSYYLDSPYSYSPSLYSPSTPSLTPPYTPPSGKAYGSSGWPSGGLKQKARIFKIPVGKKGPRMLWPKRDPITRELESLKRPVNQWPNPLKPLPQTRTTEIAFARKLYGPKQATFMFGPKDVFKGGNK